MFTTVEIRKDVDIEFDLRDVIDDIASLDNPTRESDLVEIVNQLFVVCKRITPEMISAMSPNRRDLIRDFFARELKRWEVL
jgi:hypothetical protein